MTKKSTHKAEDHKEFVEFTISGINGTKTYKVPADSPLLSPDINKSNAALASNDYLNYDEV